MPSYITGELIKEMRSRKKFQQRVLLENNDHSEVTISRIENNKQHAKHSTTQALFEQLQIDKTFYCPYLDNQGIDSYNMRDQLMFYLDNDNIVESSYLIKQLELVNGFEKGINLQFLLSCKARLLLLQGESPDKIIPIINEGMYITFPEFDVQNFIGDILIFEEVRLLHTLACALEKDGDVQQAIYILTTIKNILEGLPQDYHDKEKKLVKIILTLSKFLIEANEFENALELCKIGAEISLKRNKGSELPDFAYNKACCLFKLNDEAEYKDLLHQSYFGYILLHRKDKADLVLKNAKLMFNIDISTYGTEKLSFNDITFTPKQRGKLAHCNNIGNLINEFRTQAKLSLKELSCGICSYSNLSKIENGQIQADVYTLEAIMQRLGRDINLYINTFLSLDEFKNKQLRNEIDALLSLRRPDEAEKLLNELKTKNSYQSGVNLQFIKLSEAVILYLRRDFSRQYREMLLDALKITIPDFDEQEIENYRLTYYEILLISKIACDSCVRILSNVGLKIFKDLIRSIDKTYVDELEKIRTYGMITYNYSKELTIVKRFGESLDMIQEGEDLDIKHGRLLILPSFAVNMAIILFELGHKQNSIPYFAMSYYGTALTGRINDNIKAKNYAKEKLNIIF